MTAPPIQLQAWAVRWAIPAPALEDLLHVMGVVPLPPAPPQDPSRTSESYVQSLVRLEAPRFGVWLTRNNVGACQDKTGRLIRYGLANESAKQNETLKSADLIGWRSFVIQPHHVGARFAQFVSRECKKVSWSYGEDRKKEDAQLAWAALVTRAGGDARFVQGEGSFG